MQSHVFADQNHWWRAQLKQLSGSLSCSPRRQSVVSLIRQSHGRIRYQLDGVGEQILKEGDVITDASYK